ncbi:hypothetical protein CBR_g8695 [Chara braunii]|uniref:Protein kinase domain-containing protein n=1 Tax=Chara braunii TaxID=69332 RepID=A0A388KMJ0_CHABU|nr:hypothetical protein CBR_g8695 [Chara braunii]|eukprot:GBG71274.1 hypothetical protein CBR_g8695 [Chara braunii]
MEGDCNPGSMLQLVPKLKMTKADIGAGGAPWFNLHPHKPWLVFAPPSRGSLQVWDFEEGKRVALWSVDSSYWYAYFIGQKDWIVAESREQLEVFELQNSTLQSIVRLMRGPSDLPVLAVHPTSSYLLSRFERNDVALWDWEWEKIVFKGHSNRVRAVAFHPTEFNLFASSSRDSTIKVWDMEKRSVMHTIQDDCIPDIWRLQFCCKFEKPLLITGGSTKVARVWDYQQASCIAKLEGHKGGVRSAFFHPHIPYIFTMDRDGEIKVWNELNYQLVLSYSTQFTYGIMAPCRNSNKIVASGDGEILVLELVGSGIVEFPRRIEKLGKGPTFSKVDLEDKVLHMQKCQKALDELRAAQRIQAESQAKALEEARCKTREVESMLQKEITARQELDRSCKFCERLVTDRIELIEVERATRAQKLETLSQRVEEREGKLQQFTERSCGKLSERIRLLEREKATLAEKLEKVTQRVEELECELKGIKTQQAAQGSHFVVDDGSTEKTLSFREYSVEELRDGTENFDEKWKRGDGDPYGCCFLGKLASPVWVRKISPDVMRDRDDPNHATWFKTNVVERLRLLHHPHLLTLMGACYADKCLVYQRAANGSVMDWIFSRDGPRRGFLPWYVRLRLIAQVARALSFLHSAHPPLGKGPIIHGAIKPANILLVDKLVAKLGAVDQALIQQELQEGGQSQRTAMLMRLEHDSQYVAPEYLRFKILDKGTDIYAFGITVLEILTGKLSDAYEIVEAVVDDDHGAFLNVLDPNAGGWDAEVAEKVARLGLRCASLDRRQRPDMTMAGNESILSILERVALEVDLADAVEVASQNR